MNKNIFAPSLVLLIALNQALCLAELSQAEKKGEPTKLERTIRRYFASMGGYQEHDLITRSQVEELQGFLRKTGRRSLATHPKLLHRVLPDGSRLAKLFYSRNGANVLRAAAMQLGSYAKLEALTRTPAGHAKLTEAVSLQSVEAVLELVAENHEPLQQPTAEKKLPVKVKAKTKPRNFRVYTLSEFLNAALATPEATSPTEELK